VDELEPKGNRELPPTGRGASDLNIDHAVSLPHVLAHDVSHDHPGNEREPRAGIENGASVPLLKNPPESIRQVFPPGIPVRKLLGPLLPTADDPLHVVTNQHVFLLRGTPLIEAVS
jgi:hypothetical protein